MWSHRDLQLEEIVDAVAVDLEANPTFDPRNRMPYPRDIIRLCEGLIVLTPVVDLTDDEDQKQKPQFQLTHYGRRFLLSSRAHAILGLSMGRSVANAQIAKICLAYLFNVTAHRLPLEDLRSQFPFAQYSARHWYDHARVAEATDHALLDIVESFLSSGNAVFGISHRVLDPDRTLLGMSGDRATQIPDPLYIASLLGLEQIVGKLIQDIPDINAKRGFYGNPLQAASFAGHHSVVQILLSAGADVGVQDEEHGTALHIASLQRFDKVVQILLDGGADVNAQGGRYGTAFQAASAKGYDDILHMLLDNGADINAVNGSYGTPLQAVFRSGSYEKVQTLLDMGADVNAQDEDFTTVLYGASQKGLSQIVQTLLYHGAEIDARGGEYGTALQVAALEGYHRTVKMLLNHRADVNALSGNHGTALQIASEEGHESIVRILLDGGADVMTAGQPRSTLIAAQKGHAGVIKLLLDQGADVSTTDAEGWTPVNRAADGGHLEVVKLLIENGADIEIMNSVGRTPVYSAAEKGHLEIIGALLDSGAEVNEHGVEDSSAIWGASHRGHDRILQVQLARANRRQEGNSSIALSEFHDLDHGSHQTQITVDGRESADSQPVNDDPVYGSRETLFIVDDRKATDSQPVDDDLESVKTTDVDILSSTESLALSNVGEAVAREISEHLLATDRQAINLPGQHHDLPPLDFKRDLFENLHCRESSSILKTKTHAICLDLWKQGMSRIRDSIVWSGLILGPLEPGYTRITWKNVSSAP
jgi:ankyrin repeat protein